jgi:methylmalonyl-CoA/ethylmalonyl-CoA epimerase
MKIFHIGIAVSDLTAALAQYRQLFPIDEESIHSEIVDEQGVELRSFPVGDQYLELLGATRDDSPIAKFIAKRGEGIHHIAVEVDDIVAELARLKALGVRLIDETPRRGAHDMLIAFIHPSAFNGVLLELSQKRPTDSK